MAGYRALEICHKFFQKTGGLFFMTPEHDPFLMIHHTKNIFPKEKLVYAMRQMMKVTPTETVMMQGTDSTSFFKKNSVK
jgi:hypothetical protein